MAAVDAFMKDEGAAGYYSESFRVMLESYLGWLQNSPRSNYRPVKPLLASVYEGDLFGFLMFTQVPPQLHWITLRMNDLYSPHDFGPTTTHLWVPDQNDVSKIFQAWRTQARAVV